MCVCNNKLAYDIIYYRKLNVKILENLLRFMTIVLT